MLQRLVSIRDKISGEVKKLRVAALKYQARSAYQEYNFEVGRYDCGAALAEHINPRVLPAKQRFNALMDKLAVLDPLCPTTRL